MHTPEQSFESTPEPELADRLTEAFEEATVRTDPDISDYINIYDDKSLLPQKESSPADERLQIEFPEAPSPEQIMRLDDVIQNFYTTHTDFEVRTFGTGITDAGRAFYLQHKSQHISITRTVLREHVFITVEHFET